MFPFKTKQFSLHTDLTVEQLQERLKVMVQKKKLVSLKQDGKYYGTINSTSATIQQGQGFVINSFLPVMVFNWAKDNTGTIINGYYRVALPVLLMSMLLPLFGLYLAIKINNIIPIIFLSGIWIFIYASFGRWLFNKDFKWVKAGFRELVGE